MNTSARSQLKRRLSSMKRRSDTTSRFKHIFFISLQISPITYSKEKFSVNNQENYSSYLLGRFHLIIRIIHMDLTCLNNPPPIPIVPKLANASNIFIAQQYNPGGGGLAQAISASLARSTFSMNDFRSLIDRVLNENSNSWSVSEVVKIKPIPSIIIYTSIALALFLALSIAFCVISCRCSCRYRVRIWIFCFID